MGRISGRGFMLLRRVSYKFSERNRPNRRWTTCMQVEIQTLKSTRTLLFPYLKKFSFSFLEGDLVGG